MAHPVEASEKLRDVLDYLPCEACLQVPTRDQDILCSVCARLHRQVGVRIETRTRVLVERPPLPAPEVVPAPGEAPPREVPVQVVAADGPPREGEAVEVVVEPLAPEAPPAPAPLEAPPLPEIVLEPYEDPAPVAPPPVDEEPGIEWEDVATVSRAPAAAPPAPTQGDEPEFDDAFSYRAAPVPPPEAVPEVPDEVFEDDFVFRPPEAPPTAEDDNGALDEEAPGPVEEPPPEETRSPWAPPEEEIPETILVPPDEEIPAFTPVEEEPPLEEEILETTVVDAPAGGPDAPPAAEPILTSDLRRLPDLDEDALRALADAGVASLSDLSGRDAGNLASRTGVPAPRLEGWIHVADLVHEVGVPVDPAVALVRAGIAGPRGLAEGEAEEIHGRVEAAGGGATLRELRRWKRRA